MDDKGDEETLREQLRAIDESKARAQRYLDRTTTKSSQHLALPSAHWRETGTQLSVAQPGQPRCGARAIEYAQPVMSYGLSLVLRNPASCIRPRGHDGQHASEVIRHVYRKSLWKALAWDSVEPPPTAVLLSPDFNAPSPLWPSSAAIDAMVSQSLLGELIAWQREFDSNYDWEAGWRTDEAKTSWAATSVGLVDKVREAVAGKAELTVNLWPLGEPERRYP